MKTEYANIVKVNEDDIFESDESERISLNLLFYEEQQENLKLEQNNFSMCNNLYNGKLDINGEY